MARHCFIGRLEMTQAGSDWGCSMELIFNNMTCLLPYSRAPSRQLGKMTDKDGRIKGRDRDLGIDLWIVVLAGLAGFTGLARQSPVLIHSPTQDWGQESLSMMRSPYLHCDSLERTI